MLLEEAGLADRLEQQYRIGLMGLAGRAIYLAGSGRVMSEAPYLEVAKEAYPRLRELGDDVAAALERERRVGFSLWDEWETQDVPSGQIVSISAERYPLAFFAVRLMELANDSTVSLNVHGHASRILDWFNANSVQLENCVQDTPNLDIEQKREFAVAILQASVARDTAEEEREIVGRELSEDRVSAFRAGIEEGTQIANAIEFLFGQEGILTPQDGVAESIPEERGFRRLLPKAYFMEPAESDQTYYAPIEGDEWGRGLTRDAIDLLCESLANADEESVPLESLDAVFNAVAAAIDDLDPAGSVAIVMAGDWGDVTVSLYSEELEDYEPYWRLTGEVPMVVIGRYRGHPILRGSTSGERRLYVFEPSKWGRYVRVRSEDGEDLRVEVQPVSEERAQELLLLNPQYFAEEPDEQSRLRKLQAQVEVTIGIRHAFRVVEAARARIITSGVPSTGATC